MFQLAKKQLKTAILAGLFLGAVSFLVLIVSQKSFRSSTDMLIVQNQEGTADYYAMSRSVDYLSNILSQTIYSEKFLDETIATGKISAGLFSGDQAQKLKTWQKIISIKKNSTAGILSLEVFGDTAKQTKDISDGALDVLINKNSMFLGANQNLKIQILSGPIVEKNPSVFQIAITGLGGIIVGILLTFLIVFYREEFFRKEKMEEIVIRGSLSEESKIENYDYLSENSDYWKERIDKELL